MTLEQQIKWLQEFIKLSRENSSVYEYGSAILTSLKSIKKSK